MSKVTSFTIQYEDVVRQLRIPVYIANPLDAKHGDRHEYIAVVDTGAVASCISPKVVNELHLDCVGSKQLSGIGGISRHNEHLISLYLPEDIPFGLVQVTEASLRDFDVLLGMDVIAYGNLEINNATGKTILTYTVNC